MYLTCISGVTVTIDSDGGRKPGGLYGLYDDGDDDETTGVVAVVVVDFVVGGVVSDFGGSDLDSFCTSSPSIVAKKLSHTLTLLNYGDW